MPGAVAGKDEGGAPPLLGFAEDLKLVRRFWADDLRRMAGRWASEMGAMDMMGLNAAMADVPCWVGGRAWKSRQAGELRSVMGRARRVWRGPRMFT